MLQLGKQLAVGALGSLEGPNHMDITPGRRGAVVRAQTPRASSSPPTSPSPQPKAIGWCASLRERRGEPVLPGPRCTQSARRSRRVLRSARDASTPAEARAIPQHSLSPSHSLYHPDRRPALSILIFELRAGDRSRDSTRSRRGGNRQKYDGESHLSSRDEPPLGLANSNAAIGSHRARECRQH